MRTTFLTLCFLGMLPALARGAPLDTSYLRQHAETRGFLLGRPVKPKPTPDGKAVLFLRAQARKPRLGLYEFNVATGQTRELLTPEAVLKGAEENLTPEEKARRERQRVSVGGFTDLQLSEDGRLILLSLSGKLYVYDRVQGAIKELATGAGTIVDPQFAPDGKQIGYVRDHDVCVYDLASGKEHAVTTGGTAVKTHGVAEFVAQEEMHRHSGFWWSPDSKHIAYEEVDHQGVEVWYVGDPAHPEQAPSEQFYPRPGKANVKARLGMVPAAGGDTVWVNWDPKQFEYLARVVWDKHGGLVVLLQDRKQHQQDLFRVDPATGKLGFRLSSRLSDAWIDIDPTTPRFLADGSLLMPGNDGLVIGHPGAGSEPQPHPAEIIYRGLVSVDETGRKAYYLGTPRGKATEMHLYRVDLPEPKKPWSKPEPLTRDLGQHSAVFSKDHSVYVLTTTNPGQMPRTTVHKADGSLIGELPSVAEEPPFKPAVEFLTAGDRSWQAVVVRPRNFDPKKKYPVIVDVYGGPLHQHVVPAMRSWLLPQWLADQGFVVVALDNRGTPGRGLAWEIPLYQKLGSVPLDDQAAGLKALGQKYPELDLKRVGIVGWSFGGYLSALAVLKRPDVYKAAVAGAPVTDWEDYDTHYTERYLGLLPESKQAYEDASLLPLAVKLERPLLLVHGTADDNVYFRHTLRLTDALFRAGKEFEVLPLPSLTHMVPDPVVTERLWSRIAGHFQKHLGQPE